MQNGRHQSGVDGQSLQIPAGAAEANSLVKGDLFRDAVGDQHGHHQAVDGDDARHDHGDDGLHDELRPHHRHGGDARAALGRAVGRSQGCRGRGRKQSGQDSRRRRVIRINKDRREKVRSLSVPPKSPTR